MQVRDLEQELDVLILNDLNDVSSVISRFGHGDCHDLSWALLERGGFGSVMLLRGEETGVIVHSCVLLDENTTLDAYGINTAGVTIKRYGDLASYSIDERVVGEVVGKEWFVENGMADFDGSEDVLAEFEVVLHYMGVELDNQGGLIFKQAA